MFTLLIYFTFKNILSIIENYPYKLVHVTLLFLISCSKLCFQLKLLLLKRSLKSSFIRVLQKIIYSTYHGLKAPNFSFQQHHESETPIPVTLDFTMNQKHHLVIKCNKI